MTRQNKNLCMKQQQRGFSIIEGLFSALILAIALLALAGFHVGAFQDSTLVKARMAATTLAQEKLDDLRGFTLLKDDAATTTVDECDAGTFCYSEIASNAGGKEKTSGALLLPMGSVAGYQDSFSRTWDVKCATSEPSGSALTFGTTCTNAIAKLVTVEISWTDNKGDAQKVALQSVIYSMDPASAANVAVGPVSGQPPKIKTTPGSASDSVSVPINTSGTKYKESSKPTPDVSSNAIGAEVSFDAVSYTNGSVSGTYDITQREEFVTVSCECSFASATNAYTPSRMVWNGSSLEAKVGDVINKVSGTPANGQSDLCTACCKDHHDVTGSSHPKYDPDRPSSEYTSGGNHKHYWYSACVTPSTTTGKTSGCNASDKNPALGYAEVDAGAYLDSCRFKRVDGYWRLWQDWRQVKMTVIPYDFLSTSSNLNAYIDVIEAAVENAIRIDSANGTKAIPAFTGRDLNLGIGGTKQLLGRGLYVDRIFQKNSPTTLDSTYYTNLVSLIDSNSDWLNIAPFYEANLTLLVDWSSSNASSATVTKADIVDVNDVSSGYYGYYSRGLVTAVSGGTATITATGRLHNSGITGGINVKSPSYGISAYDNSGPLSDSITVTVPTSTTPPTTVSFSGNIVYANSSVDLSTITITATGGVTCTPGTVLGNSLAYTCNNATVGSNVTLTYASSASNYSFSPASQTVNITNSVTTAANVNVYGPTVKIWGNRSATSSSGSKITGATLGGVACTVPGSGASYQCNVNRGTSGYTGMLTITGNKTYVTPSSYSFSGQQADTQIDVTVSN